MLSVILFVFLWTAHLISDGLKTQQAHIHKKKNTTIVEKWRKSDTETSAIWIKNIYFPHQLDAQILKVNLEDHDALERAIRRRKDDVMT